jgi:hypothetical protein
MLDPEEAGPGIDRHQQVPRVLFELGDETGALRPGVVEQYVEAAEQLCAMLHESGNVGFAGDVAAHEVRLAPLGPDLRRGLFSPLFVDVGHDHARALAGEQVRGD